MRRYIDPVKIVLTFKTCTYMYLHITDMTINDDFFNSRYDLDICGCIFHQ